MTTVSKCRFDQVDKDLMHCFAEKSKNVEIPINVRETCKEFKEFSGSTCTSRSFENRFYKFRHYIHKMDNFDIETKVKMLFATSTPVDFNFLNELKKEATVEVDEKHRITNYIANDGRLKLKGYHGQSSKKCLYYAERRRSEMPHRVSSNDFKGEEEELDVDVKYKNNESLTSSGRVFNFSKDADDDELKSSTEKKAKKTIESIDSSSIFSSINNPSSSFNLTPEIQRTEPSNEVIYDGPGEPSLPFPLMIKPEAIQYPIHPEYQVEDKPIPFDQYNMQLQSEHRENLIDDDVEFDNPQNSDNNQQDREVKMEVEDQEVLCDTHFVPAIESTNSDEFFKLLQNIVKTLDSEMFSELERDIQTEMETFRNQNRKIQVKDIKKALRTTIDVVIKAAKPKGSSSENTTSLKGFLMLLNMIALSNSALTVIQQEIQGAIRGLGKEDKTVSIKNIRTVLETMLLMVTS